MKAFGWSVIAALALGSMYLGFDREPGTTESKTSTDPIAVIGEDVLITTSAIRIRQCFITVETTVIDKAGTRFGPYVQAETILGPIGPDYWSRYQEISRKAAPGPAIIRLLVKWRCLNPIHFAYPPWRLLDLPIELVRPTS